MILELLNQKKYVYLLIFAVSFLLYGNSLSNKYALDDAIVITQNDFVKKGFDGIPDILTTELFTGFFGVKKNLVEGGRYRPLSLITFAVEYELFGENPTIGHLLNIIFYGLTGVLLYLILLIFFKESVSKIQNTLIPLLGTLLWLFHPLHTEVVANIKGRDEIFALLGSLWTLYLIIGYLKNKKLWQLLLATLVFFLSLLSKEMSITFLLIIPLSLYFFSSYTFKQILIPTLLLLVPTFIFLYLRQSIMGEPAVTGVEVPKELMNHSFLGTSLSEQFATIIFTLLLYIKLLFIAYPMTFDYYPFHIEITNFTNPWVIISIVVHLALAVLALKGFKKKSIISFGIFYYAITFSIVSNILFPIGTFMSERFMYMPSIGWSIIVAYLIFELSKKIKTLSSTKTSGIAILLFVIPFAYLTINRNKAWANDYMLFTTDVETSVGSAKSNTSAGGKIIEEVEKLENIIRTAPTSSIKSLKKNIEKTDLRDSDKEKLLNGNNSEDIIKNITAFNKANLLQAKRYLNRAVKIHPTYTDALLLLGNVHYKYNKNFDSTWVAYETILKRNPRHDLVAKNWTIILNDSIDARKKIEYHKNLLRYNPNLFENNYQIGHLFGRSLNQLDSSIIYLEKALALNPKKVKVYKDLGVAYGMSGQFPKALPVMLKAHELDPNDAQILINIGVTYQKLGDLNKAQIYFNKANALKGSAN